MKRDQGPRIGWAQTVAISVIYLGALAAVIYLWTDRPPYVTLLVLATAFPVGVLVRWMRRTSPIQPGAASLPVTPSQ
jgi:hypothetical protein